MIATAYDIGRQHPTDLIHGCRQTALHLYGQGHVGYGHVQRLPMDCSITAGSYEPTDKLEDGRRHGRVRT